ncbi:hypothetical protein KKG46_03675 [Patescibacteria group bacterium]|nr:hypothetical protein [Patescibacteria group bacterium]
MRNFNQGGGGRFDRGGRGGRDSGGRGFDKPMFSVVCAECGDKCQVPFRPTGDRPVLCNECFRGGDDRGSRPERRNDRFSRNERPARDDKSHEQFEQLNVKLDMIIKEIDKLKQASRIHTVESMELPEPKEEKASKKAKKVAKEDAEEKTTKTAAKKETKKSTKKVAKKSK